MYVYIRRKSRVGDVRRRIRMRRPRTREGNEDGVGRREIYLKFIGSFLVSLSPCKLLRVYLFTGARVHAPFTLERNDRGYITVTDYCLGKE